MIITQFKGRLGNQLFQYAAAKQFAVDGHTELKLDLTNYEKGPGYILDLFNVPQHIATQEEISYFTKKDLSYYFERFLPYYKRRLVFEKDGKFDKNLVGLQRDSMYVRGYFQSEKYFNRIEDTIRKEFTLKKVDEIRLSPILSKIRDTESVSLHIRRADFLAEKNRKIYELIPLEYYKAAIRKISSRYPQMQLYIFSDDIEWVKNNLDIPPTMPRTYVSGNNFTDIEEFYLMSQCKHNITGNSTFSWWAAWLNGNKEKMIITPDKWFVKDVLEEDDLIPPTWIRL